MSNLIIYKPKRKYNRPRKALAINPKNSLITSWLGVNITITNNSDKTIYVKESPK